MKKLVLASVAALVLAAGVGAAIAQRAEAPGPTPAEVVTEAPRDDVAAAGDDEKPVKRSRRTVPPPTMAELKALPGCTPSPVPETPSLVWFSNREDEGVSPIAEGVRDAVCAAAPGSTIRVAMYFVKDDSEGIEKILRALESVATKRDVTVQIVLDSSTYERAATPVHISTLERLRAFADVYLCLDGCRSEQTRTLANGLQSTELQHNKFVIISDTAWDHREDPLLIQSSANWSGAQMDNRYQSAVMLWRDPVLAAEFGARWDSFQACATDGCRSWNPSLVTRGLDPKVYQTSLADGVWGDDRLGVRHGTPGRGTSVAFSPWTKGRDPLAEQLDRYTCDGKHDTVWVAHMFITRYRQDFIKTLARLQEDGCDVRIIMSSFARPLYIDGARALREHGLEVACVERVHEKIVVIDAVTRRGGEPAQVLWTGSHSVGYDALRRSDEALLRVDATRSDKHGENAGLWEQFRARVDFLGERQEPCPTVVDPDA